MSRSQPTYVGTIRSLTGAVVSIELRSDLTSTLTMVQGESHRVGQIGSFIRIPLGYASVYGIVTQVGAAAAPSQVDPGDSDSHRWLSVALFGEAVGGRFERGVTQYPTVGDEAHVVTTPDLETIYASVEGEASLTVGTVSSSSGIPARLDVTKLVARHAAIVGSTGSGKSNAVAVLLESIATQGFPNARVLVLDAHGEYGSAVGNNGYVFKLRPSQPNEKQLVVPFWALPADELISICMGRLATLSEAAVRDAMGGLKRAAAQLLPQPPPTESITVDSPIPFSAKRLWFELDDYERATLADKTSGTRAVKVSEGDANALRSNVYPAPSPGNAPPFLGPRRGMERALELMKSRLSDSRFAFLLDPGPELTPTLEGAVTSDLDSLLASWIGHDRPITVLDISGLPADAMAAVTGTVLRIVYDALFWAGGLPTSGRNQPLLIVLEEAHRILPAGVDSPAMRATTQIAKEGRKYGVGLLVVTQRPTEIEPSVLSQCGTMISLRLSNAADRGVVASTMPDDLGNLASMLPALRTGEGLAVGEALPIPTRLRFRLATSKPHGDDPNVAKAWRSPPRPDPSHYSTAISNWRRQSQ